jgi:predicted helicase
MPRIEPELQRLQEIKSLPSLIKYLKTDLNWPIESDAVEDVTFDYDPAELGFDSASTAKIEEVRQLRPLTPGQKWGIFWVKFGKKQLPVQMLRRALGNLVVKKRASTKKSDKAAWHMHDLLFISAYGDDSNRHITFAHFSESEDSEKSLPVLKVLGWDEDDTLLHLKYTYKTLLSTLNWETTPTDDPEAWRNHWSSAFKVGHREVINTTKELVVELAHLATVIKKSVLTSIKAETERGPWKKLMLAFQKTLIKDLDDEQFADVIAQTISYGLLTARLSSDGSISLKNLVDMVPSTNPFLKELLQHFLTSSGMKGLFDVDEAGINDVVELLNRANAQAIRNDFGKKTAGEDPVIHFYEHFLGAYNKKLKVERGVFYTPQPVVSYIVRSVHEILQKEFGLEDGLADTSTWAEVQKRYKTLKIPEGIKDPKIEPFVQILDPATGTATFLIEVIEVIHNTMTAKWDKERIPKSDQIKKWNTYVPIHLLPRLYAYELMMAPYAIAHMKVGLKLGETGFTAWDKLGTENRANIYLTNALETWATQLELPAITALAHEASSVNDVKRGKYFTVIIGNPPYSRVSTNRSDFIQNLMKHYKEPVSDEPNQQPLDDDYIKFIRLSHFIQSRSGCGVIGYITNHTLISGILFRGVRQRLCEDQTRLHVVDLHGNSNINEKCEDGSKDENIFDIQAGVSILLAANIPEKKELECSFREIQGTRISKYSFLNKIPTAAEWICLRPCEPYFFLKPVDLSAATELTEAVSIKDIFIEYSTGLMTVRDNLAVAIQEKELASRFEALRSDISDEELQLLIPVKDYRNWSLSGARHKVKADSKWRKKIVPVNYRPFDKRWIYYSSDIITYPNFRVMDQFKEKNIGLITSRIHKGEDHAHEFVTREMVEIIFLSSKSSNNAYVFPLHLTNRPDELTLDNGVTTNLTKAFRVKCAEALKVDIDSDIISSEKLFYYIYATLNSPTYRRRYNELLKIDFPKVLLTSSKSLYSNLVKLGEKLVAIHLLESPILGNLNTKFTGNADADIQKATWSHDTVWIDKNQKVGFKGVKEAVWNFYVGGYQVCEKWLKDRKGRKLSKEDIEHYQKIVVALSETIRLMAEIDKVIDEHGGWPGAFQSPKSES